MMQTTAALTFGSPVVLGMASAIAVQGYVWRMAMAGPVLAMRVSSGRGAVSETTADKARPKAVEKVAAPGAVTPKPAAVKSDAPKAATPKADPAKAETPKPAAAKPQPVKADVSKPAAAKPEPVKAETAKAGAPKPEPMKAEAPKTAAPEAKPVKADAPKAAAPKTEPVKAETPKTEASKEAPPKSEPAQAAGPEGPVQPPALAAPRGGKGDDLTLLAGVGPKLAETLNGFGIHHFDQIAAWTPAHVAWMDENLGVPGGRASRGDWVTAAAVLSGTA
ncbi:hypothetical protein EAT49_16410 [Histidinibacterium lentulum]|uniref:NADH:ubiquinone oxidoreductase n=2 Tax=Histidinibacterium lentulum TaxID=2480588 RepID=A0A3N2QTI4_9RHOB|nr:hypothetical protein EAT49_16410 [Histidinibacterium lentulum]